MFLGC